MDSSSRSEGVGLMTDSLVQRRLPASLAATLLDRARCRVLPNLPEAE